MARRIDQYRVIDGQTRLDQGLWNRIFEDVDARIAQLEDIEQGIASIRSALLDRSTRQLNDAVIPIITDVENTAAQATTELTEIQTIQASAQAILDALVSSGVNNISGNLTVGGDIGASNLSGSNTGDEAAASSSAAGIVKIDGASGDPTVYRTSAVDTLIAGLQQQIDDLTTTIAAPYLEGIGAYGAVMVTNTNTRIATTHGSPHWVGIQAINGSAVIANYDGINNFTQSTLENGHRLITRTASFQLASGQVLGFLGKPA